MHGWKLRSAPGNKRYKESTNEKKKKRPKCSLLFVPANMHEVLYVQNGATHREL